MYLIIIIIIMNTIMLFVYEDALEYFSPYAIYHLIIYTAAVLWTVWIGISVGLGFISNIVIIIANFRLP